ncbi:IS3 family transposase [Planococcus salinarum]|uniref:IS3 family transposase n=1 Tax=Planococcus salinarum TaxID=622695 RepID=UPI0038B2C4B7
MDDYMEYYNGTRKQWNLKKDSGTKYRSHLIAVWLQGNFIKLAIKWGSVQKFRGLIGLLFYFYSPVQRIFQLSCLNSCNRIVYFLG